MTERRSVVITGVGVVNAAIVGASPALGAWLARPRPAPRTSSPVPAMRLPDATLAALVDGGEARRLSRVFREDRVLVSSTKSMIGHAMAASGSLEAVATVLALAHDLLPPTASLVTPDPEVRFDCLPGVAREAAVECAISNSFGFGGQNVTLLFQRV